MIGRLTSCNQITRLILHVSDVWGKALELSGPDETFHFFRFNLQFVTWEHHVVRIRKRSCFASVATNKAGKYPVILWKNTRIILKRCSPAERPSRQSAVPALSPASLYMSPYKCECDGTHEKSIWFIWHVTQKLPDIWWRPCCKAEKHQKQTDETSKM